MHKVEIACPICGTLFDFRLTSSRHCSPACSAEAMARKQLSHEVGGKESNRARSRAQSDPTPAEIAAAVAELRAGWSDEEYYDRAGVRRPMYEFNAVRVSVTGARGVDSVL